MSVRLLYTHVKNNCISRNISDRIAFYGDDLETLIAMRTTFAGMRKEFPNITITIPKNNPNRIYVVRDWLNKTVEYHFALDNEALNRLRAGFKKTRKFWEVRDTGAFVQLHRRGKAVKTGGRHYSGRVGEW